MRSLVIVCWVAVFNFFERSRTPFDNFLDYKALAENLLVIFLVPLLVVIHYSHASFKTFFLQLQTIWLWHVSFQISLDLTYLLYAFWSGCEFHSPQLCLLVLSLLNILPALFCLSSPLSVPGRFILLWRMVSLPSLKLFSPFPWNFALQSRLQRPASDC